VKDVFLLIDSGNTRIKWAYVPCTPPTTEQGFEQNSPWLAYGAVMHADSAQLASQWQKLSEHHAVQGALIANVAGTGARQQISAQLAQLNGPHSLATQWFASSHAAAGVRNGYRQPTQLGCDRFCAAIGAHALLPGKNLIVANCGTATTIDGVSRDGQFIGGMIAPGLAMMAQALARNTAQLPQLHHAMQSRVQLPHSFADNTDDAIISGCITASAGAIEKALRDLEHRWAQPVHCVLSGGAAFALAPALTIAHQMLDNLVLHGLHTVLRSQAGIHPTSSSQE
jgi:type III pantothenate kinase